MNATCIEYEFTDLPIKVCGVNVGSFNGMALLVQDEGYDHFYVEAIHLEGEEYKNTLTAIGGIRRDVKAKRVTLTKPGLHERKDTLCQHLWAAIEASLYRDPDATEAFADAVREMELA